MGALDVVKKAADKGDLQAITLMGVCHAIGYPLLSLLSALPSGTLDGSGPCCGY